MANTSESDPCEGEYRAQVETKIIWRHAGHMSSGTPSPGREPDDAAPSTRIDTSIPISQTQPPPPVAEPTAPTQRLYPNPRAEPPPPTLAPPNPSTRTGHYPAARWAHGLTAGLAWVALLIQLIIVVDQSRGAAAIVSGLINYVSYFTILSNFVVALMVTALMINPIRESRSFSTFRLDSLLMITLTGLVYLVVLAPTWTPTGWQAVADYLLHYGVPLAALVSYGLFGPRPRLTFRNLMPAMIIPAIWVGYTLIRGAITDWYPYPFVDVATYGYATVALNLVILLVIAIALASGFILIDRKLPWAPRR